MKMYWKFEIWIGKWDIGQFCIRICVRPFILIIRLITGITRIGITITRIGLRFVRLESQYPAKFNSFLTFRSRRRRKQRPRWSRRRPRLQKRPGRRHGQGLGWPESPKQWHEAGDKIWREPDGTSSSPASGPSAEGFTVGSNSTRQESASWASNGTTTGSPPSTTQAHHTDGPMTWGRLPMPGGFTRIKPEGLSFWRACMAAWPHWWSTLALACASWSTRWRTRCKNVSRWRTGCKKCIFTCFLKYIELYYRKKLLFIRNGTYLYVKVPYLSAMEHNYTVFGRLTLHKIMG